MKRIQVIVYFVGIVCMPLGSVLASLNSWLGLLFFGYGGLSAGAVCVKTAFDKAKGGKT